LNEYILDLPSKWSVNAFKLKNPMKYRYYSPDKAVRYEVLAEKGTDPFTLHNLLNNLYSLK
jgi:hypothetical protein